MAGTNIFSSSGRLGIGLLSNADTVAICPLGTIQIGKDEVTGVENEYMYVQYGVITTVGQISCIDLTNKTSLASSTNQANDGIPLGFAVGATYAADEYGWLQISGKVKAKAGTVAAGGKVMLTATAGTVDDAAVAGSQVLGAEFDTADGTPAAGFAYITCNRPFAQGQIT
jgi:hypothetical protein